MARELTVRDERHVVLIGKAVEIEVVPARQRAGQFCPVSELLDILLIDDAVEVAIAGARNLRVEQFVELFGKLVERLLTILAQPVRIEIAGRVIESQARPGALIDSIELGVRRRHAAVYCRYVIGRLFEHELIVIVAHRHLPIRKHSVGRLPVADLILVYAAAGRLRRTGRRRRECNGAVRGSPPCAALAHAQRLRRKQLDAGVYGIDHAGRHDVAGLLQVGLRLGEVCLAQALLARVGAISPALPYPGDAPWQPENNA